MCFLTDANQLYYHALGLYDLELTLMVAQQAQRVSIYTQTAIWSNSPRIPVNTCHSSASYSNFRNFENSSRLTTILGALERP